MSGKRLPSPSEALSAASQSPLFAADGPCPISIEHGNLDRVIAISGENAGGKSLLCKGLERYAVSRARDHGEDLHVIRVGMDGRTSAGIGRVAIFGGSDADESTGALSAAAAMRCLKQSENASGPLWVILDEPDIGLGAGYRAALGEVLSLFSINMPDHVIGFVVVSHAPEIVGPLVDRGATSVRVGPDLRPVREWLSTGDLPKSTEELEGLLKTSRRRMNEVERARKSPPSSPNAPRPT